MPEYQDAGEVFSKSKIFETDNRQGKNIQIDVGSSSVPSLFKYFLDGARRTYKVVDFGSTDGKFLPIVAGQIGTAVCQRNNKRLQKLHLRRENVLAVPDRMGGEFDAIAAEIPEIKIHTLNLRE